MMGCCSFKKGLKSRARERLGVLEQKLKFLENLEDQLKMVEFFPPPQQNASSPDQNGEFSMLPNAVVTDVPVASHCHASDDHNHVRSNAQLDGNHFHQDEIERSKWEIQMKYQQHLQEQASIQRPLVNRVTHTSLLRMHTYIWILIWINSAT